jgi:hypothetical protein
MSAEDQTSTDPPFHRYVTALEPLFQPSQDAGVDVERLFQHVCCLVRAGGIEAPDSDPIVESTALIDDMRALSALSLDPETFTHPERTRSRLALISYAHVTEADFFYRMLASLAKVRAGHRYDMSPFADLWRKRGDRIVPPAVSAKIRRVNELASKVGVDTQSLIEEFYFKDIRNAVFHADYALTDTEFVMRGGGLHKVKEGYLTPAVPLDELGEIIFKTFEFYRAIMALHHRARRQLRDFKNKILPYDWHYKGLLELMFEDDLVAGFRTYWPNGSRSEFSRTRDGSRATNVVFEKDGSINFMVNLYARHPGTFSPLVEHDANPVYTPAPGRTTAPHWPGDLKPYEAV